MGFPIGPFLHIAGRVGVAVLNSVGPVQALSRGVIGATGPAKADAVMEFALAELQAASSAVGHQVIPSPRVLTAIQAMVTASVELHAAIADAAHPAA
jgi:hypothetical protein